MSKHTPGEWHWDSDEMFSSSDNIRHVRWRVCTLGKTITQIYRNDEHAEADARLIAAAPELLEALKAAEQCIGELSPTQARVEAMQMLQAAIAKATGAP
jgi:hypothetical protein